MPATGAGMTIQGGVSLFRRRVRQRDPAQQRHQFRLAAAAGLFERAAQLGADGIARHVAGSGDFIERAARGQTAGNARFSGSEVEQRLDQPQALVAA